MSITAYVKPTNHCNIGCTHCYLSEDVRDDRRRMTMETVRATGDLLNTMRARGRHGSIMLIWHGGEPLTIPVDWYYEAGAILDEEVPGHRESIQTSLIPYRREHAPLFRERFNNWVGSSIDFGSRHVKGSNEGYQELWMRKVDMAREDGIFISPGMVPTSLDVGLEAQILAWFAERGFRRFQVERYNRYGQDLPNYPSNKQHAVFLCGLLDAILAMWDHEGWAPAVQTIKAGINGVLRGSPGDRWGGTCQSDFVVVEPDGRLNNCPDKTSFDESYGNALEGFDAFAANPHRRHWIRHQAIGHRQDHCMTCEHNHWCKSGCPITPNGPAFGEDECAGYKTFLTHIQRIADERGTEVLEAYVAYEGTEGWQAPQVSEAETAERNAVAC